MRRRIGFIFQQHNLLAALTATENVELGLRATGRFPRGELRRRARAMLEAVGLAAHADKRAHELSGGQRQRVAIARALVGDPAIVLADEPTASLDRVSGREVVDRMQALAKEQGATILLVTHDNRILDVADRILHLEDGRISTFTEAVIANTQHMMNLLADSTSKQPLEQMVAAMDEPAFRRTLADLTQQSQRFLEATALARDQAYQSMLEQALRVFTRRVSELLEAERASLFLVDRRRGELVLRVAQDVERGDSVRIPLASGIAGAAAISGKAGAGRRRLPGSALQPRRGPAHRLPHALGAVPAAARPLRRSLRRHAVAQSPRRPAVRRSGREALRGFRGVARRAARVADRNGSQLDALTAHGARWTW